MSITEVFFTRKLLHSAFEKGENREMLLHISEKNVRYHEFTDLFNSING